MRKITPEIKVLHGVNNALNPCSPSYRQGAAWDAQNSRINKSGLWDKAPYLSACSLGAAVVRGVPVSDISSHPHFADCNILSTHIIVKNLKNDSHIAVGPNKYAYVVDDNLGSSRQVYWWDGTDGSASVSITEISVVNNIVTVTTTGAHNLHDSQVIDITGTTNYNTTDKTILTTPSTIILTYAQTLDVVNEYSGTVSVANAAAAFTDNATACNYAVAGIGAPTAAISVITNPNDEYGGRMEKGTYYYMYTYYDDTREVESLPSKVTSWSAPYWTAGAGEFRSTKYSTVTITPDASHGSRLDSSTKVRVYRSFVSDDLNNTYNSPNQFYFVDELDYQPEVASLTFDFTGGTVERMMTGSSGDFSGVVVGDKIYFTVGTGVVADVYVVEAIDSTNAAYVGLETDAGLTEDSLADEIEAYLMCLDDFSNDQEIELDPYEGRGSRPPSSIDCLAPFNNRMYYFVGNVVYWSSSGRPEEVALDYTLTYELDNPNGAGTQTTTVPMSPVLAGEISAEAKYEISELEGETVIGAYPLGNRLWVFTENTTGYLKPNNISEGVRYHLVRKGLGLVSNKTLAHTPYGLFGADREGVWLIDANTILKRLSKYVIDIKDSTKSTYALQLTLNESFGIWVSDLDEYLWCVVNTGETTVHRQLAYQPARGIFGGVYAYSGLTGGCAFVSTSGAQTFLTNSKRFDDTLFAALTQTIQLWMGQHSLVNVKDDVKIEIIYESITASKNVSVTIYQNNIASTTGAQQSSTFTHDSNNLVGTVEPHGSGRMFLVSISIPSDCQAPIISVDYSVNEVHWNEKALR